MKAAIGETVVSAVRGQPEPAIIPTLLRMPMSAMVAVSTLVGYLAFPGTPRTTEAGLLMAAIFLLAAGCSALNQVQDRSEDALMERTRRRPLPAGRLTVATALVVAGTLIAVGLLLLARLDHAVTGWGVGAVLLYNGVYTGLKKRTSFALLAGALCGVLPPVMGWCAAGGDPVDHRIVGLAVLFLLWQIPHTMALWARYLDDIATGPFASLLQYLDAGQLIRLSRVWLLALAIATLHLPAFGTLHTSSAKALSLVLAGGLLFFAVRTTSSTVAPGFRRLTLYMTALICLVILDNLPL